MTFACAGAGLDARAALACAGAGLPAGFGFARAGTAAGAGVAFAVVLGFFADFSFPGMPFGTGVAVAPCVAAGVVQDCHGQHIALAGSVRSINADTAKGTVNRRDFAFIEPLPLTVVTQARASGLSWSCSLASLGSGSGFDNKDANPTMQSCQKPALVAPPPRADAIIAQFFGAVSFGFARRQLGCWRRSAPRG